MQRLRNHVAQLATVLLAAFLLTACGMAGKTAAPDAAGPQHVEQDPQLRITTTELMELFDEVYEGKPLIKARLDANDRFLLVDARPLSRYQEGHIPGAIHMPPGEVADNIDQLPRDRQVIFYCGGLHCPLSAQAAEIAREHGLDNIRVYYEGDPGWTGADNYLFSETPYIYHMMGQADEAKYLLIDARPTKVHRKAFIPGSLSLPHEHWELKKSLLPRDLNTRLVFYCGGYG